MMHARLNAIDGRRWYIGTQERKVCDMKIEIVFLIIKGILKQTVPPDR